MCLHSKHGKQIEGLTPQMADSIGLSQMQHNRIAFSYQAWMYIDLCVIVLYVFYNNRLNKQLLVSDENYNQVTSG